MASIKYLIVDSSPLLTSPLSSLRGLADHFLITPDVVSELRDKKGRDVVNEAKLHLFPATTTPTATEDGDDQPAPPLAQSGFIIRQPSLEAIAKVTSFAHKTGDIAVLSSADIRVLALCLTLELEENGSWRVRDFPGQVLTGPPTTTVSENGEVEKLAQEVEGVSLKEDEVPVASTSAAVVDQSSEKESSPVGNEDEHVEEGGEEKLAEGETKESLPEDEEDESSEGEDEEDGGESSEEEAGTTEWITPSNLSLHKAKDLGLFEPPTSGTSTKSPTKMKAAVLTGDFAMQNVGIQMGLNVLGSGGKRVREVRTWVLRCHGCFKLCKSPTKRFCPSCGGPTLLRTSITYVPASPANPKGYILHLKQNFQYRLRGTVYSLPTPKMGKAGGGGGKAEPVLREDQKEWVRGVRSKEIREGKEIRRVLKSVMADGTSGSGGRDREWVPEMDKGEKGRKRGGKNGVGGEVRVDSSGLPVIAAGRKNINESRRRR